MMKCPVTKHVIYRLIYRLIDKKWLYISVRLAGVTLAWWWGAKRIKKVREMGFLLTEN